MRLVQQSAASPTVSDKDDRKDHGMIYRNLFHLNVYKRKKPFSESENGYLIYLHATPSLRLRNDNDEEDNHVWYDSQMLHVFVFSIQLTANFVLMYTFQLNFQSMELAGKHLSVYQKPFCHGSFHVVLI